MLITDCDEVLLHMVSHFDAWLEEAHGIRFAFETGNFGGAMTVIASAGRTVREMRMGSGMDGVEIPDGCGGMAGPMAPK